jgi:hypothetical protein
MAQINEYIFIFISSFMDTCTIYLSQDFFPPQFCDGPINKEGRVRGQVLGFLEFDIQTKVPDGYLFCSQKFQAKANTYRNP